MLDRDVTRLAAFFAATVPELATSQYGKEIWNLFEAGLLTPETPLTGIVAEPDQPADVAAVMREIALAREEEAERVTYQMSVDG